MKIDWMGLKFECVRHLLADKAVLGDKFLCGLVWDRGASWDGRDMIPYTIGFLKMLQKRYPAAPKSEYVCKKCLKSKAWKEA